MLLLLLVVLAFLVLVRHRTETFEEEKQKSEWQVNIRRGMGANTSKAFYREVWFSDRTSASFQFQVSFGSAFAFGCKGKIGGFHIGRGPSSGGEQSDASSFRVMWDNQGRPYMYVYFPTSFRPPPPNGYGHEYFKGQFPPMRKNTHGQPKTWNTITMSVVLNGFRPDGKAKPDGSLTLLVDGRSHTLPNIVMRTSPSVLLNRFVFNVFHGGPCVASKDMTAWIRR